MPHQEISFLVAFVGGLLSFFSPCILPLIPAYLSYVSGMSVEELSDPSARKKLWKRTLAHSLVFILGFSLIFIGFGASATAFGKVLRAHQIWLQRVGGVLIMLFGLQIMGALKIPFLERERRIQLKERPLGYLRSFLTGTIFSVAWVPCVGPIFAAILVYASTTQSLPLGIGLLVTYSMGLGIPFLISSVAFNSFLGASHKARPWLKWVSPASGLLLFGMGLAVATGYFNHLSSLLVRWFPSWR